MLWVPSAPALFGGHASDHAPHVAQGYLGINFRDVPDEQAAALRLQTARGEEVILIDHDGPAAQSGLREHDVLLQINGQPIEGEEQLRRTLRETPAGRWATFLISRDGQQQTISIQLADRQTVGQKAWERHMTVPEPPTPSTPFNRPGFFGGNVPTTADLPRHGLLGSNILSASYTGALLELIGPQLADFFGAQSGLLVHSVVPDSPAAAAGLRAGDVVVKIDAVPIVSAADWVKTVHDHRGRPLSVVVLRDKKEQVLTLTPDSKKRSSLDLPSQPNVGMVAFPSFLQ
jgi:S1-C subfamily serine protease